MSRMSVIGRMAGPAFPYLGYPKAAIEAFAAQEQRRVDEEQRARFEEATRGGDQ